MLKPNNTVNLTGRATAQAELVEFENGGLLAKFTVATNDTRKRGDKYEDYAEFHNVYFSGDFAKTIAERITKGMPVQILGKLEHKRGETKELADGTKITPVYSQVRIHTVDWDSQYKPKAESK